MGHPPMILLLASCILVGTFVGAVGIGGVLLIPALMIFSRLPVHEAAATALFSFFFTGLLGSWLFSRRGTIEWRVALPVCLGAFVFSLAGAAVGGQVSATLLIWIIAVVLLSAGVYILFPTASAGEDNHPEKKQPRRTVLFGVGIAAGFGAGLSGAGGPVFSVPIMLSLQVDPLIAVGTGQLVQIASSLSGSLGNLAYGTIQYGLAIPVTLAELVGVVAGVRIAHSVPARYLRRAAAGLCILSAVAMIAKSIWV
jgi:uncharacterized membrane protein YfcA